MKQIMDFEKPIVELKEKIAELKNLTQDSDIDMTEEIATLENRLAHLEDDIYGNLQPWDRVQMARHKERPTTLDYINKLFTQFIEFHGDRRYGDDEAIVSGIGYYQSMPVTIIGHQRGRNTKENIRRNFGMPHPEGYRKALRHMQQAEKFNRPIITFIDTKGADPGKSSEERGQSEAIARNLMNMAGLRVPVICIVIGEGGSGGALALGVGDEIHMLENATYSVISPEGAAALLWKDSSFSKDAAESMQITSYNLQQLGVVDSIIPEPKGGAHRDIDEQAESIDKTIASAIDRLGNKDPQRLVEERWNKYKNIGDFSEI